MCLQQQERFTVRRLVIASHPRPLHDAPELLIQLLLVVSHWELGELLRVREERGDVCDGARALDARREEAHREVADVV